MRYTWIDEYLTGKPGVTKDFQAEWKWIRYHIGGKMFAAICLDDHDQPYYITLKLMERFRMTSSGICWIKPIKLCLAV